MLGTSWTKLEKFCIKKATSHEPIFSDSKSLAEEVADALCTRAGFLGNSHPNLLIERDKKLIGALMDVAKAVRGADSEVFSGVHSSEVVERHSEREVPSKRLIELDPGNSSGEINKDFQLGHNPNPNLLLEGNKEISGNSGKDGEEPRVDANEVHENFIPHHAKSDISGFIGQEIITVAFEGGDNSLTLDDPQDESISFPENRIFASSYFESLPRRKSKFPFKKRKDALKESTLPAPQSATRSRNRSYWERRFRFLISKSSFERFGKHMRCAFRRSMKNTENIFSRIRETLWCSDPKF